MLAPGKYSKYVNKEDGLERWAVKAPVRARRAVKAPVREMLPNAWPADSSDNWPSLAPPPRAQVSPVPRLHCGKSVGYRALT